MAKKRGHVRAVLSPAARRDIRDALKWSETKFGHEASLRYEALIVQALRDIEADPDRPGSAERPEMLEGVRTYHISLSRARARSALGGVHKLRHFIVYRLDPNKTRIEIGRILRDDRDLVRHLPEDYRS